MLLAIVDVGRHGVEQGPPVPELVPPEMRTFRREATTAWSTWRDGRRNAADLDEPVHADWDTGEFADRKRRTVDRQRGTTALTRLPSARRASTMGEDLIYPPSDRRDDLLDDAQKVLFVLETHRRRSIMP